MHLEAVSPTTDRAARPLKARSPLTPRHSLTIRKLILRHHPLDCVALDAIAEAAVGFDGEAADDGVDLRLFDLRAPLRTLAAVKDGIGQTITM